MRQGIELVKRNLDEQVTSPGEKEWAVPIHNRETSSTCYQLGMVKMIIHVSKW